MLRDLLVMIPHARPTMKPTTATSVPAFVAKLAPTSATIATPKQTLIASRA